MFVVTFWDLLISISARRTLPNRWRTCVACAIDIPDLSKLHKTRLAYCISPEKSLYCTLAQSAMLKAKSKKDVKISYNFPLFELKA